MAEVTIDEAFAEGLRRQQAGELAAAEQIYRQILEVQPRHADSLHLLGVIARDVQRFPEAIALIRQAIAIAPNCGSYHANLGEALRGAGESEAALAASLEALRWEPENAVALNNVGVIKAQLGRYDEAIAAFRLSLGSEARSAEVWHNLGLALYDSRQVEPARSAYEQSLALNPGNPVPWNSLGNAFIALHRYDEAIAAFQRAIALAPHYDLPYTNMGCALRQMGRTAEAIPCFQKATEWNPGEPHLLANLIFSLHFHHGATAGSIRPFQQEWNRRYAAPLRGSIRPHANERAPERRLRVGYVSPNFWGQAECHFVIPLLEAHDRERFEIHCYSSVEHPDEITRRLRAGANVWHDVQRRSDEALAEKVRADGINILVDLTMHMAHSRLPVFARKPAPVQVTWLAYPGSSGLEEMDYRMTDARMDPPTEPNPGYAETSICLPDAWCCYDPIWPMPACAPRPVRADGLLRFGSLNGAGKLNEPLLRLWARLLREVPRSRLVLLADEGSARDYLRRLFASWGIAPERLEFAAYIPREKYLLGYDQIDLALDPLPYNGITTTCDALWMGVPVLTLTGETAWSRAGLSLLTTAGLPELVTHSEDDFIALASALARDDERRAALRSTLRARLTASPLMDAPRFARNLEQAYREMWRRWCAR